MIGEKKKTRSKMSKDRINDDVYVYIHVCVCEERLPKLSTIILGDYLILVNDTGKIQNRILHEKRRNFL